MNRYTLWIASLAILTLGTPLFSSNATAGDCCWEDAQGPCCESCRPCRRGSPQTLFHWQCCPRSYSWDAGPLVTDRPDFTESSSTVDVGRAQVEMGYTYTSDSANGGYRSHSGPEALLRVGLLANWLELRVVTNYLSETTSGVTATGMEDMSIGVKIAFTEQCCWKPATAVILQTTLPTGSAEFQADRLLPGMVWIYSWDLNDRLSLAGNTGGNQAVDSTGHGHLEISQSLSAGASLSDQLGSYLEWYGIFPHSANATDANSEHYLNGGVTWLVHDNLQLDLRVGVGLNAAADNFLSGAGLSYRY